MSYMVYPYPLCNSSVLTSCYSSDKKWHCLISFLLDRTLFCFSPFRNDLQKRSCPKVKGFKKVTLVLLGRSSCCIRDMCPLSKLDLTCQLVSCKVRKGRTLVHQSEQERCNIISSYQQEMEQCRVYDPFMPNKFFSPQHSVESIKINKIKCISERKKFHGFDLKKYNKILIIAYIKKEVLQNVEG